MGDMPEEPSRSLTELEILRIENWQLKLGILQHQMEVLKAKDETVRNILRGLEVNILRERSFSFEKQKINWDTKSIEDREE